MTKNIDDVLAAEEAALANEQEILDQIDSLRSDLGASRRSRRHVHEIFDQEAAEEHTHALRDAQRKVADLEQEVDEAEAEMASLNRRLDKGDASVSVEDLTIAERTVDRALRLLKAARSDLMRAERSAKKAHSDHHLAHLAGRVVEQVSDIPVIIRRDPKQVPEVEEAIILSQTRACENYGTLKAEGSVDVTLIGKPSVNWKAINEEFAKLGGQVQASPGGIIFDQACWPTPRLHRPSLGYLSRLQNTFSGHFANVVENRINIYDGAVTGYTGKTAFVEHGDTGIVSDQDGQVEATVELYVAATSIPVDREAIAPYVEYAVDQLPKGDTELGRIEGYEIESIHAAPDYEFANRGTILGSFMPWKVVLTVRSHYEKA